jgi:hypothetical protein
MEQHRKTRRHDEQGAHRTAPSRTFGRESLRCIADCAREAAIAAPSDKTRGDTLRRCGFDGHVMVPPLANRRGEGILVEAANGRGLSPPVPFPQWGQIHRLRCTAAGKRIDEETTRGAGSRWKLCRLRRRDSVLTTLPVSSLRVWQPPRDTECSIIYTDQRLWATGRRRGGLRHGRGGRARSRRTKGPDAAENRGCRSLFLRGASSHHSLPRTGFGAFHARMQPLRPPYPVRSTIS